MKSCRNTLKEFYHFLCYQCIFFCAIHKLSEFYCISDAVNELIIEYLCRTSDSGLRANIQGLGLGESMSSSIYNKLRLVMKWLFSSYALQIMALNNAWSLIIDKAHTLYIYYKAWKSGSLFGKRWHFIYLYMRKCRSGYLTMQT